MDYFVHFDYFEWFVAKVLNIAEGAFLINLILALSLCLYSKEIFIFRFSFKMEILSFTFKKLYVSKI
jgi:hypothetical protein